MKRFDTQLAVLLNALQNTGWWTLKQLSDATGSPEPSVSANLRHLRKKQFGGHKIERRRLNGTSYTWEYSIND
jgi:hypothetical protein